MQILFKTREQARKFHSARKAKGLPGRIVDNGSAEGSNTKAVRAASRYAVSIR